MKSRQRAGDLGSAMESHVQAWMGNGNRAEWGYRKPFVTTKTETVPITWLGVQGLLQRVAGMTGRQPRVREAATSLALLVTVSRPRSL